MTEVRGIKKPQDCEPFYLTEFCKYKTNGVWNTQAKDLLRHSLKGISKAFNKQIMT